MLEDNITDSKVRKYSKQIDYILENKFQSKKVEVYLYGSRSRDEAHYASDIDLAVQSSDSISSELSKAKEAFFESTIPYKIDVVDLETIDESFKKNILNDGVLIWKN